MEIAYKSKNIIGINKPYGMPSQPDPTGDADAMTVTAEALKSMGESDRLWLVHRLDRRVGGAMLFARSSRAAAEISTLIQDGGLEKEYYAVVSGECEPSGIMTDYLYKDIRLNKAFVVSKERKGVKKAELTYTTLESRETSRGRLSLVKVRLITGRFHQIRAQFSSRGMPLVGDKKYGSRITTDGVSIALFSADISVKVGHESVSLSLRPNIESYPFSEFKEYFEKNND